MGEKTLPQNINDILDEIVTRKYNAAVLRNVPMRDLCTFRLGGEAACLITPKDISSFCHIIQALHKVRTPYYLFGGGSNIVPPDGRFLGIILSTRALNRCCICGHSLIVDCGVPLNTCILSCAEACLSGFESLYGIPATVGGALVMNAGAHGREIGECLRWIDIFDIETGRRFRLLAKDLAFSYRYSLLQTRKNWIVLQACFHLYPSDKDEVMAIVRNVVRKRRAGQPLEYPSAGSIFRRPSPEVEVWRLVDGCGMRGIYCGGAQVSEKHAGFIVNRNHATAADVRILIDMIIHRVRSEYGVTLTPEVEIL